MKEKTIRCLLQIRDLLQPNDLFVDTDFDETIQLINLAIETCVYYEKSYQNRKETLPSLFEDRPV